MAVLAACTNASAPTAGRPSARPDTGRSLCDAGSRLIESRLPTEPERPFLLAAPPEGGRGRPLVIALHGSGGTPAELEAATHLAARGPAEGVSVVLPSAADEIWHNFSLSDQPYLDAVVRHVLRRTCADPHAVVLTGFSNGGDEAQTMGGAEAKRWRARGLVAPSTIPHPFGPGGPPAALLRVPRCAGPPSA